MLPPRSPRSSRISESQESEWDWTRAGEELIICDEIEIYTGGNLLLARALRALGLLLADGAPIVGWGKTC